MLRYTGYEILAILYILFEIESPNNIITFDEKILKVGSYEEESIEIDLNKKYRIIIKEGAVFGFIVNDDEENYMSIYVDPYLVRNITNFRKRVDRVLENIRK
jgi:hypothetical protein